MAAKALVTGRKIYFHVIAIAVFFCMPLLLNPYYLIILNYALVLSIGCLGLNLLFGNTGLVSFGHAAYFGLGAYTGTFLYTFAGIKSLEVFLLSGLICAISVSAVIGAICVRATRIHFTILTLAFAQMLHALFISGIIFRPFGGVGKGLFLLGAGGVYIPRLTIFGTLFNPDAFNTAFYYVTLIVFFVCAFIMWQMVHSPFGKALRAVRDNDIRAEFVGVRVRRYRWVAFIISAGFTALAGGLFGQLSRQMTPQQLHWVLSAKLVLATVLGGTKHFLGPVVGAFTLEILDNISLRFTHYRNLISGVVLIIIVLVLPGGLTSGAMTLLHKIRGLKKLWYPSSSNKSSAGFVKKL